MISNLKKNDRIVTSFGVHGVVVSTQPDAGTVTIRLDENTNAKMTVNRDTIRVVKKD
jgi:preprotein translocase subunit YajC